MMRLKMTDQEAIAALSKCIPLAKKVRQHGVNFPQSQEDATALADYLKVYTTGRAFKLLATAGLSEDDYLQLGKLAARRTH
jgi:hypothetical protein